MPVAEELIDCRGINGSISLSKDKMVVRSEGFGLVQFRELPINKITAVVVERKSVIPFAMLTILAATIAAIAADNPFWFLFNLTQQETLIVTMAGVSASVVCAIPTLFRLLFVNILVRSEGEPNALIIRFVLVRRAKRLARQFREFSSTS